ncbi:hypothetical protein SDC9_209372 [bioreactor metagenome]|uniref:Uncharacterized protein n=1 Tax=bioreactor metagenome TaxID=1076179 RepID=A0A645JMT3_9ZZZZ
MPGIVSQFCVNLIRDDHQVVFPGKRGDAFQILAAHYGAGRVIWKIQHQDLGARSYSRLQHFPGQPKAILRPRGNRSRHTMGKEYCRSVGNVAGLVK